MIKKYSATLGWFIPLLIALASFLFSAFTGYAHSQEHANTRISVIETKQDDDRRRLDSIDKKLDEVVTWTHNR